MSQLYAAPRVNSSSYQLIYTNVTKVTFKGEWRRGWSEVMLAGLSVVVYYLKMEVDTPDILCHPTSLDLDLELELAVDNNIQTWKLSDGELRH